MSQPVNFSVGFAGGTTEGPAKVRMAGWIYISFISRFCFRFPQFIIISSRASIFGLISLMALLMTN